MLDGWVMIRDLDHIHMYRVSIFNKIIMSND